MTSPQILAIACGVLGVALVWALFSRYAWKARALDLYDRLTKLPDGIASGEEGAGVQERRTTPRDPIKKPSSSISAKPPAQPSSDSEHFPFKKSG